MSILHFCCVYLGHSTDSTCIMSLIVGDAGYVHGNAKVKLEWAQVFTLVHWALW